MNVSCLLGTFDLIDHTIRSRSGYLISVQLLHMLPEKRLYVGSLEYDNKSGVGWRPSGF